MILLIIHAPDFWKWLLIPGLVYIVERIYRTIATTIGSGKSNILKGNVLPSRYIKNNSSEENEDLLGGKDIKPIDIFKITILCENTNENYFNEIVLIVTEVKGWR